MREYMHLGADADMIDDDPFAPGPIANPAVDYGVPALKAHCAAINAFLSNPYIEARPIDNEDRHNSIGLYLYGALVHEWIYVEFGDQRYLIEDAGRIVSIIEKSLDAAMRTVFGGAKLAGAS